MIENDKLLRWYSPAQEPFALEGFAFYKTDKIFRRMPIHPEYEIPDGVDRLANHTAGGQIRFKAKLNKLVIKSRLNLSDSFFPHFTLLGQCGFDCYVSREGTPRFYSTVYFAKDADRIEHALIDLEKAETFNIVINFPLYSGVDEVLIGVDENAELRNPEPRITKEKIIFYGTSITQGGFANRPGMAYTNIISRWLNIECINLGFASNGTGDKEVAKIIAGIDEPACLVLDYEANCPDSGWVEHTMYEFIKIFRQSHPRVPIIAVSRIPFAKDLLDANFYNGRMQGRAVIQGVIDTLKRAGDCNLEFIDGGLLFDECYEEYTADGVHPTDLGFMKMAQGIAPVINKMIGDKREQE